jgi:hypothetical protein
VKKFLFWGFWAVVAFYVFTQPHAAAGSWHQIMAGLTHVAHSLTAFATSATH